MRQRSSLDIIADDRQRAGAPAEQVEADTPNPPPPQDSRSTSSTSSPAPPDNEESDFFLVANDSQSSLGVPNLQDMHVDDECIPPINRLPNEIQIAIFVKLSTASDILHVMLTCKRWAHNAVDILWHRPACTTWEKHIRICQTLGLEKPYFPYRNFIRRLNLASLADKVNDGSVMPLFACTRVERLTLTGCSNLTDSGLIGLVQNNNNLLALDISGDNQVTESSIDAISEHCPRLQGLNVSGCDKISNESMIRLAQSCRYLKRLKLNDCNQLRDEAVLAFAQQCPNILEIDLHQCREIGNEPVTALIQKGQALRELRLVSCERIDDSAFLSLPPNKVYEHLRILDLTCCARVTDRAVEKIIEVAPRLRNLVLAKCRNITDAAVYAIAGLGKNLHYLHLGHCSNITDDGVKRLVQACTRIRYIDLACCIHLTDDSVTRLATLPKLKRIGLVKCDEITDETVIALANANRRPRVRRDAEGNILPGEYYSTSHSSLERVHLSYCTNLTLRSIIRLLNCCPRLTHLSLTGVQAFLREDLESFSRDAPPEFTDHQRSMFCVFSGQGVVNLRRYLNSERAFSDVNVGLRNEAAALAVPTFPGAPVPVLNGDAQLIIDAGLEDVEADAVEDDDGLEDSEMVIDAQPLLNHQHVQAAGPPRNPPVPSDAPGGGQNPFGYVGGHAPYVPQPVLFQNGRRSPTPPSPVAHGILAPETDEPMEVTAASVQGVNGSHSASPAPGAYQPLDNANPVPTLANLGVHQDGGGPSNATIADPAPPSRTPDNVELSEALQRQL